jgi:CO dehydrogenase/acetyl-CoA synthase gamma subunit (corrinoid Fe-S protein)
MALKACYHCGQKLKEKEKKTHDCWSTTEEKLTEDLSEPLKEAWLKIREIASHFGEQRIYASHKSIMFSKKTCYFFVRPKKKVLEVVIFLKRTVKHPLIRKTVASSKIKTGHVVHITHSDFVEAPFTDWLKEAYEG